jgi:uncharacterized protein (TIGR00369 family)
MPDIPDHETLGPSAAYGELIGYRLVAWRENYAEVELELGPQHLNGHGIPHGGLIMTLLDSACGYAGVYCAVPGNVRHAVTLSLTTQFVGQARGFGRITAIGRKTGGGRHIYFTSGEIRDADGRLIAQASGTFRYRKGSEDPAGQPRAG